MQARCRLATTLLASLAAVSCADATPPPRVTPRPARTSTGEPAAPPLPPRWVNTSGATLIGPATAEGTLVLVGGRRAMSRRDGTMTMERVATPEPLLEVVEVPTAAGFRLVGHGVHGIYRLDDPLGPVSTLARSEEPIAHSGGFPGLVAVWTAREGRPRFVDIDTGRVTEGPALPALPLRDVAFLDTRLGAAVFEGAGLAVTTDGGATWRGARGDRPDEALEINGVRRRGGSLRAFRHADSLDGLIDVAGGRLERLAAVPVPAGESVLLRWLRVTRRDPLEALTTVGLELPTGAAVVASHGLVARIDPATGTLLDLVDFARGDWVGPCGAGRAGHGAWIACTLGEGRWGGIYNPFGVLRMPFDERPPFPERPALVRNGDAELRVSPSGGALLMAPCQGDEPNGVCVRQPDGRWVTVASKEDLEGRGAGALADGRVAYLRGTSEAETNPTNLPAKDAAAERGLRVVLLEVNGKEHVLPPLEFPFSRGHVRVQSPIEEHEDHTLRFVIEDGDGPFAVVNPLGREPGQVARIGGVTAARLHGMHGIAIGEGPVVASMDGGWTWEEVPAPPAARSAAREVSTHYDEPGQFVLGDLGAKIGSMLRIGWGTPDDRATNAEPLETTAAQLPSSPPDPPEREQRLACGPHEEPSPSTPPLLSSAQVRSLFSASKPGAPGARGEASVWARGREGMLDAVASMEENETSDAHAGPRITWVFRWFDPRPVGARVQIARATAPMGAPRGASLRFAAASSDRALFVVRSGRKSELVRASASGAAEALEVPAESVPSGEVAFATDRSQAIAWIHETNVMVWLPGQRPRSIGSIAPHAWRSLGTPTRDGVPILLASGDWAVSRVLPLPPRGPDSGDEALAPLPSLDGWTRVRPVQRDLPILPACGRNPPGARFLLERSPRRLFDVRIHGAEACIAAITVAGMPVPHGPSAWFTRADLITGRAEGGACGVGPGLEVRRMRCSLSAGAP